MSIEQADLTFRNFTPKEKSFKYGPWARYCALFNSLSMVLLAVITILLPESPSQKKIIGFIAAGYGAAVSIPLAMIEYPVPVFSKLFPKLYHYGWRGLLHFILCLPCAIAFPMQLCTLYGITIAILYWIGHRNSEKGAPPPEPKARR